MRDLDRFRTSSFCTHGTCLGVALSEQGVEVASLGDATLEPLRFTREEWAAFVAGVKAGEFDLD